MIKAETNNGLTDVTMEGTTGEISSDLLVIVAAVYDGLVKKNPGRGELIKAYIRRWVNDDALFSAKEDGEKDD